jgi:hypothetical protein
MVPGRGQVRSWEDPPRRDGQAHVIGALWEGQLAEPSHVGMRRRRRGRDKTPRTPYVSAGRCVWLTINPKGPARPVDGIWGTL